MASTPRPVLSRSQPIFAVRDVRASVAFYEKLGFGNPWFWGTPVDFAGIHWGEVGVMFCQQPEIATHVDGFMHHFFCEQLDALHAQHTAANVPIVSPLENKPWGIREYTVRDPDGYHLRFSGPPSFTKPPTALDTLPTHYDVRLRTPTWPEYRALNLSVKWRDPGENDTGVLTRSHFALTAIDTRSNEAVGMVRVMRDAADWYSIWDVIVHPEHQNRRLGSTLIDRAVSHLRETVPKGSIVHLFTYKPDFYKKLGFGEERACFLRL
jgi:ribosomal protein S18 acetylase RimI-like enzyme